MIKIVLCGPPSSGKSCLREGLKQAICFIPQAPYPYIITGCPDGEGAWFQATVNGDPELAAKLKTEYKSKFTPAFVKLISDSVTNCTLPLTIVDIGGIPSQENEQICSNATHAIILAGDIARIPEWRTFCHKVKIKIIAEIHSDYTAVTDKVPVYTNKKWVGSVHHLERGEPIVDRPTIRKLAEIIVNLSIKGEKHGNV